MKNPNKNKILIITMVIGLWGAFTPVEAKSSLTLESGQSQVNLLELFSSEGCSSCPPADAWLASLRAQSSLWKDFVPIEFHVDYWNRLGWTDRFSKEAFTSRQRQYGSEWGNRNIYTPGLVLNGMEWRPNLGDPTYTAPTRKKSGILRVVKTAATKFYITFNPTSSGSDWRVYGALLGNGLVSQVTSGENNGRTLRHEFVVLSLIKQRMKKNSAEYSAVLEIKTPSFSRAESYSVAFWISKDGEQVPVQAVGGDLEL